MMCSGIKRMGFGLVPLISGGLLLGTSFATWAFPRLEPRQRENSISLGSVGWVGTQGLYVNIFGADDRAPLQESAYPWSAVGRVIRSIDGSIGNPTYRFATGTLIGKNLVLTSAHFLFEKETDQLTTSPIYFIPHTKKGSREKGILAKPFKWGSFGWKGKKVNNFENDWAILILEKNIGIELGYLGVLALDFEKGSFPYQPVTLAGYSNDHDWTILQFQDNCSIQSQIRNDSLIGHLLLHDCDAWLGNSGGPIFQNIQNRGPTILAIHAGHSFPAKLLSDAPESKTQNENGYVLENYHPDYGNLAIPAMRFIHAVLEALSITATSPELFKML